MNQNLLVTMVIFASIGLIEWLLALTRTIAVVKSWHAKKLVPLLTFLENVLALLVFQRFITQGDISIAIAYSLGCALGSLLPLYFIKGHNGDNGDIESERSRAQTE